MVDDDRLLAGGLAVFAEVGYERATVRLLAERLGVSPTFFGDRYGSKLGFWKAVMDAALASLAPGPQDQELETDPERIVIAAVRFFATWACEHSQANQVITDEAMHESERLDHLFTGYLEPALLTLWPSVQDLIGQGRMRPLSRHLLYYAIAGPLLGLGQQPLRRRLSGRQRLTGAETRQEAEAMADFIIAGLLPS